MKILLSMATFIWSSHALRQHEEQRNPLRIFWEQRLLGFEEGSTSYLDKDAVREDAIERHLQLSGHIHLNEDDEYKARVDRHVKDLFGNFDADSNGELTYGEFSSRFSRLDVDRDLQMPEQLHLSLTEVEGEMLVQWITYSDVTVPFIEFWSDGQSEQIRNEDINSFTYDVPTDWWKGFDGWVHTGKMTDLNAGEKYFYRVGHAFNGEVFMSEEFSFYGPASPTAAGNKDRKTTIATLGDQGTVMPLGFMVADQIIEDMKDNDFDAVLLVGDVSYAGISADIPFLNFTREDEFTAVWDLYGFQNEPFAARIPFITGIGNHEKYYDWISFTSRYTMPQNGNGNFWFSVDIGNIHITSVSSEHDYQPGSPQHTWAVEDLRRADANRENVPWIIFIVHRPLWCSAPDDASYAPHPVQAVFEDMLQEFHVDMTVAGHIHCYERIHPLLGGITVDKPSRQIDGVDVYDHPQAPPHVVLGNGGALQAESWIMPKPDWSAVRYANGVNPDEFDVPVNGLLTCLAVNDCFNDIPASLVNCVQRIPILNPRPVCEEYLDVLGLTACVAGCGLDDSIICILECLGEHVDVSNPFPLQRKYSDSYGYARITAENSTHLHVDYDPVSGVLQDEFWIVKG